MKQTYTHLPELRDMQSTDMDEVANLHAFYKKSGWKLERSTKDLAYFYKHTVNRKNVALLVLKGSL